MELSYKQASLHFWNSSTGRVGTVSDVWQGLANGNLVPHTLQLSDLIFKLNFLEFWIFFGGRIIIVEAGIMGDDPVSLLVAVSNYLFIICMEEAGGVVAALLMVCGLIFDFGLTYVLSVFLEKNRSS